MSSTKIPLKLPMSDLQAQYRRLQSEIDASIREVLDSSTYINGPQVKRFAQNLAQWTGSPFAITCGNGTDALQLALMALNLEPGDEVIVPAFTYVATAEAIGLLGLTPVLVDVNYDTFTMDPAQTEAAITSRSRVIVPVHLFGQCADMTALMKIASDYDLYTIEDNAQALGSVFADGGLSAPRYAGTIATIGCTSFFPSKNLGCFGDGGAMFTADPSLAQKLQMLATHGQRVKYHHSLIGCNSRLDSIQAAVLDVKLRYLKEFCAHRSAAGRYYTAALNTIDPQHEFIIPPVEVPWSTHTYHQYTLKVPGGRRDALQNFLARRGIPSMIYYPLALQEQEAYKDIILTFSELNNSKTLAREVLSIPVDTEITHSQQDMVIEAIADFTATL